MNLAWVGALFAFQHAHVMIDIRRDAAEARASDPRSRSRFRAVVPVSAAIPDDDVLAIDGFPVDEVPEWPGRRWCLRWRHRRPAHIAVLQRPEVGHRPTVGGLVLGPGPDLPRPARDRVAHPPSPAARRIAQALGFGGERRPGAGVVLLDHVVGRAFDIEVEAPVEMMVVGERGAGVVDGGQPEGGLASGRRGRTSRTWM